MWHEIHSPAQLRCVPRAGPSAGEEARRRALGIAVRSAQLGSTTPLPPSTLNGQGLKNYDDDHGVRAAKNSATQHSIWVNNNDQTDGYVGFLANFCA